MFKQKTVGLALFSYFLVAVLTFSLSLSLAAPQSYAQNRLPELGTTGGATMSIAKEQQVGDLYMRQLRGGAPLVQDPVLNEYLSDIGNRLVRHADNVKFPFEFFWINNPEINAFAFFGGKVGVHTGLIHESRSESELASVIGHEIAHVTQRHIVRGMEAQKANSPGTMAAMVAGILLAIANPELGMATMTAAGAGGMQSQINYTRQFEQEADRVGIGILANAGFDPQGAPDFFGRLSAKYRYTSRPPEMLQTHPLSEKRVADTRQRADMLPRPTQLDSQAYHFAKARIAARYMNSKSIKAFERDFTSDNPTIAASALYGAAIVSLDAGRSSQAMRFLEPLLQQFPRNSFVLDVHTDILLDTGRVDEAVDMLKEVFIRRPNEPVVTLNLANASLAQENYDFVIKLMRDFLLRTPDDLLALDMLSTAYRKTGNLAAMYETNGEIYALRGGFKVAIDEFHTAHTNTDNVMTKKRLQARINQVRELEQQTKAL